MKVTVIGTEHEIDALARIIHEGQYGAKRERKTELVLTPCTKGLTHFVKKFVEEYEEIPF